MTLLTTVASNLTSYTDATAPSGFVYYQIEIVSPNTCNPTKQLYNSSRSNVSTNDPNYAAMNELDADAFTLYPNPASEVLYIGYEGLIEKLEIIDMKGAVVYTSTENKKEHVLPVSLESGFFVVLLQTENGTFRKELVIQR